MALALTDSRLLEFRISKPDREGRGRRREDLVSEVALDDVDSIEPKRLVVGVILIVAVRGEAGG